MMKICFITCVNNQELYNTCLKYINELTVPTDCEVKTIAIYDAKSIASGYNQAMKKSDAEYKVYLHQDTFIINKNFISDIVKIFISNNKLGMIGVLGSKDVNAHGCWWNGKQLYGKLIDGSSGKLKLEEQREIDDDYQIVKYIDGLIMITQYDIPWREDIFNGWHYYDLSQCLEFYRNKYLVCIPKQTNVWCIHDCGIINWTNFEYFREIFLKEYANDLFFLGYFRVVLNKCNKKLRPFIKKFEVKIKTVRA